MIKIHILQHVSYENPGSIETWARKNNHELSYTEVFNGDVFPDISSFDWLLIMGGPMSVNDDNKYEWLQKEKVFIKSAIDNNKILMGICLGSQLIANVLGSEIFLNEHKEIGWFPVRTTIHAADHDIFSSLPRGLNVFHWHAETFNLPEGALLLAESNACKNQLFVWNEKVIGMQFHLEITETLLNNMVDQGKSELKKKDYVQTKDEILSRSDLISQNAVLMESVLNNLQNKFNLDV